MVMAATFDVGDLSLKDDHPKGGAPSTASNKEAMASGFEGAHFPGFIKQNMKVTNHGDIEFVIQIPFRYFDLTRDLAKAFGRPLEFFIVPIEKQEQEGTDGTD